MSTLVRAGMTPAERCRYVAHLLEAHPENFDMMAFAQDSDGFWTSESALARGDRPEITECGTTCCVAGWAVATTPASEVAALPSLARGTDTALIASAAVPLLGLANEDIFYVGKLDPSVAAFLLRWHADELDRA